MPQVLGNAFEINNLEKLAVADIGDGFGCVAVFGQIDIEGVHDYAVGICIDRICLRHKHPMVPLLLAEVCKKFAEFHMNLPNLDGVLIDGEHITLPGDRLDQQFGDHLVAERIAQPLDPGRAGGFLALAGVFA